MDTAKAEEETGSNSRDGTCSKRRSMTRTHHLYGTFFWSVVLTLSLAIAAAKAEDGTSQRMSSVKRLLKAADAASDVEKRLEALYHAELELERVSRSNTNLGQKLRNGEKVQGVSLETVREKLAVARGQACRRSPGYGCLFWLTGVMAEKVGDVSWRTWAMINLAYQQARASRALTTDGTFIRRMGRDFLRVLEPRFFPSLEELSLDTFKKTAKILGTFPASFRLGDYNRAMLASVVAYGRQDDDAVRLMKDINDSDDRDIVRSWLAVRRFIDKQAPQAAFAMVDAMETAQPRAQALKEMAGVQLARTREVRGLLARASFNKRERFYGRDHDYDSDIAAMMESAGKANGRFKTLVARTEAIKNTALRADVLVSFVEQGSKAVTENARSAMEDVDDARDRVGLLSRLAIALYKLTGRPDLLLLREAHRLALTIEDPEDRMYAFVEIASAWKTVARHKSDEDVTRLANSAYAIAKTIQPSRARAKAFATIGPLVILSVPAEDEALSVAGMIEDVPERAYALTDIAVARAMGNRPGAAALFLEALLLAETVKDSRHRAWLLQGIALRLNDAVFPNW